MINEALELTSNCKALGPGGIENLHLKITGPIAREYLAGLATLSFSCCRLRAVWKQAIVITLLKPGKQADQASSYRPVNLLTLGTPVGKNTATCFDLKHNSSSFPTRLQKETPICSGIKCVHSVCSLRL